VQRAAVNRDGRLGNERETNRYDRIDPGRFVTFCHVDGNALKVGWVKDLERSAAAGARG